MIVMTRIKASLLFIRPFLEFSHAISSYQKGMCSFSNNHHHHHQNSIHMNRTRGIRKARMQYVCFVIHAYLLASRISYSVLPTASKWNSQCSTATGRFCSDRSNFVTSFRRIKSAIEFQLIDWLVDRFLETEAIVLFLQRWLFCRQIAESGLSGFVSP